MQFQRNKNLGLAIRNELKSICDTLSNVAEVSRSTSSKMAVSGSQQQGGARAPSSAFQLKTSKKTIDKAADKKKQPADKK